MEAMHDLHAVEADHVDVDRLVFVGPFRCAWIAEMRYAVAAALRGRGVNTRTLLRPAFLAA